MTYTEISLWESCKLVQFNPTREIEASKVNLNSQVEIFNDRQFLIKKYRPEIKTSKKEQLELFFAGLCIRRNRGPDNTVVIRIPSREVDKISKTVKSSLVKLLNISPKKIKSIISIEEGPLWSWIIVISKELTSIVNKFYNSQIGIPQKIEREPLAKQMWFFKGLIEAMGVRSSSTDQSRFHTSREEIWLRKYFQTMAFFFGMKIKINATPSYFPIQFRFNSPEPTLPEQSNFQPRIYSRIRAKYRSIGPLYKIQNPRRDFSPVIGCVPLGLG